ncbi:MAG: hypothetical protein NTZ97_03535 [Candidatus Moranbacteria bacterium]|nr:hypothetical protein [Candidatus Moranbacteria bacterium]
MKKETLIWQVIALAFGLFFIFTIKAYLVDKITIEAMDNDTETMSKRASCFALAEEKNLNDAYCKDIDTTIYTKKFFDKIEK